MHWSGLRAWTTIVLSRSFKRQLSSIDPTLCTYHIRTYVRMCIIKCQSNIRLALASCSHKAVELSVSYGQTLAWVCGLHMAHYTPMQQLHSFIHWHVPIPRTDVHYTPCSMCSVRGTNKVSLAFQLLCMYICTYTRLASLLWCKCIGLCNGSDDANAGLELDVNH